MYDVANNLFSSRRFRAYRKGLKQRRVIPSACPSLLTLPISIFAPQCGDGGRCTLIRRSGGYFCFSRILPQFDVRLQLPHHFLELHEVERLRAVANGFLRCGMHLHD